MSDTPKTDEAFADLRKSLDQSLAYHASGPWFVRVKRFIEHLEKAKKAVQKLELENQRLSEVNDWLDQRCIRIEGDFAECVRVGADLEVKVQQLKKQLQESSDG